MDIDKQKHSNIYLYIIFSFLLLSSHLLSAQSNQTFRLDTMPAQIIELNDYWKYHPGDKPEFAQLNFPDQDWDTISPALELRGKDTSFFPGIGWFRLHLEIDSSLFNKTCALSVEQRGASEIFFNGEKIETLGLIGNDSIDARKRNPKDIPILLTFDTLQKGCNSSKIHQPKCI